METTTETSPPITITDGSFIIKGRTSPLVLLIRNGVPSATLPANYNMDGFAQDLEFALVEAMTSRSPIEQEIKFLKEFKVLYEDAKTLTTETQEHQDEHEHKDENTESHTTQG